MPKSLIQKVEGRWRVDYESARRAALQEAEETVARVERELEAKRQRAWLKAWCWEALPPQPGVLGA